MVFKCHITIVRSEQRYAPPLTSPLSLEINE